MKNFGSFLPTADAVRLRAEVTKTVFASNQNVPTCRRVTPNAATTVVTRSLTASAGLPTALRHHLALVALGKFIDLAQHNRSKGEFAVDTDLLPIAHPRASRIHALTASALREAQVRWIASDPRISDEHRPLVAAALATEPNSVEHFYAVSRLEAAQDGIALQALVAAFGDGNSRAAKSARARRQRRDRKGRFAWMGGGLKNLIRRLNGQTESMTGRFVKESDDGESFEFETPDGGLYRIKASNAEAVKAVLQTGDRPDGYAGVPADVKTGDPVTNEADLVRLDHPSGYQPLDDNGLYGTTNGDDYRVQKFTDENGATKFRLTRNDSNGTEVGVFDNWTDTHRAVVKDGKQANKEDAVKARLDGVVGKDAEYDDFLGDLEVEVANEGFYDGPAKRLLAYFKDGFDPQEDPADLAQRAQNAANALREDAADASSPDEKARLLDLAQDFEDASEEVKFRENRAGAAQQKAAEEAKRPDIEWDVPEGAFNLDRNMIDGFVPGRMARPADNPEYTDDPVELAQMFDTEELRPALAEALKNKGYGNLEFDGAPERVPAPALYRAMEERGADADVEVARIYDDLRGDNANQNKLTSTREGSKITPEQEQDFRDAVERSQTPVDTKDMIIDRTGPKPVEQMTDAELDDAIAQREKELLTPSYGTGKQDAAGRALARLEAEKKIRELPEADRAEARRLSNELLNAREARSYMESPIGRQATDAEKASADKKIEAARAELDSFLTGKGMKSEDISPDPFGKSRSSLRRQAEGLGEPPAPMPRRKEPTEPRVIKDRSGSRRATSPAARKNDRADLSKPSIGVDSAADLKDLSDEELDAKISEFANYELQMSERADTPAEMMERGADARALEREKAIRESGLENENFLAAARKANEDMRQATKRYAETLRNGNAEQRPEILSDINKARKSLVALLGDDFDRPRGETATSEDAEATDGADVPDASVDAGDVGDGGNDAVADLAPDRTPARRESLQPRDLKPGDVVITDRPNGDREYFIVDEVREGGDKGKLIIKGHYPGHVQQEKQWNPTLRDGKSLAVVRGADVPPPGDGPEIHKPDLKDYLEKDANGKVLRGEWAKDENGVWYATDPAKQARYQADMDAAMAEAAEASKGFDDPTRGQTAVPNPNEAPAPRKPQAPFPVGAAPLQGRLAEIAREADGDVQKFRELLAKESVFVFDFETTGIVKDENGNMVSPGQPWAISVARIDPLTGDVIEQKTIYMNPEEPLSDWAKANLKDADGNPLTDEWLAGQRGKGDAFAEVTEFLGDSPILIGHNVDFDEPILRENADNYDLPYAPAGIGDTMSLSRYLQRDQARSKNRLGDLADKYGIENPDWHNAENDVRITGKIFDALLKDFETKGDPFDINAMQAWHDGRVADYNEKKAKFENEVVEAKAEELVADAMHSEEKPDIDKAVSEASEEIKSAESPVTTDDDEDFLDYMADDAAEEAAQRANLGEKPGIGEVVQRDGIEGREAVYVELDNGDRISVIDDGFGNKESAYLKWDAENQMHHVQHWSIRKWDKNMSNEDIARQHLDAIYGESEGSSADADIDSAAPDEALDLDSLPETDNQAIVKNAASPVDEAVAQAMEGIDANSEINGLADEISALRGELDAAQNDKEILDKAGQLADALEDLGDALYNELPRENNLNNIAKDIRSAIRGLRRKNRKRSRGGEGNRPAPRQPRPAAEPSPEAPADAAPTGPSDNGGIPADAPTSVEGAGGLGARTPAGPGERARGVTEGADLPGAVPAAEGDDEPVGPDGRKMLRRGRENRVFWAHKLFGRWDRDRRIFNRPWEGQFADRDNVPLAEGDKVTYIGPGKKRRGQQGVVVGRKDNMERWNGLNRDYVLVRFDDGSVEPFVSRNLQIDPSEDISWRFLVHPDEQPNDTERWNLPAGFDWDKVRRGSAPQNTRGANGELRGEGRDQNNVPIRPGDVLQKQERHELEGRIADRKGRMIFVGDRVENVMKPGRDRGLINGTVIGKKYKPVIDRDGNVVGYGYYVVVKFDNGETIERSAKSLEIRGVSDTELAGRKPDNPKASVPTIKKRGGEWVPDDSDKVDEPIKPAPPAKNTMRNAGHLFAEGLNRILADIRPKIQNIDIAAGVDELDRRARAAIDGINAGGSDADVAAALRDLGDAANRLGDRIRASRDDNALMDDNVYPADMLNAIGGQLEAVADNLEGKSKPKQKLGPWSESGLEVRTDVKAEDVNVGDYIEVPNRGLHRVVDISEPNSAFEARQFFMEDKDGNRVQSFGVPGNVMHLPVHRKPRKGQPDDPFIPRAARRKDVEAKDLKVGDFIPTRAGKYGRIISKEVSARNGAVRFKVEYADGRQFEYNWWRGNVSINGALITSGRVDAAPENLNEAATPAAPASPVPPAPNAGGPTGGVVALDRSGNPLAVGDKVVHRNAEKYAPRGEAVVKSIKKDKDGRSIVSVKFADGSTANFKSEFLAKEAQNQQGPAPTKTPRPASDYEDALRAMERKLGGRAAGIGQVLNAGGDIADLDLPTRSAILRNMDSVMEEAASRGDNALMLGLAKLSRDLTNAHLEQYPVPESLGPVGDELVMMDMDNVIFQMNSDPNVQRNRRRAGAEVRIVDANGNPTPWKVVTLNMGIIGFTFFMEHDNGERFVIKKEGDPDKAAQEVVGAAVARGLGIPGATFARLHGRDKSISIQTYAGSGQPLVQKATPASQYRGNLRGSDMWLQNAADFTLLDAIIHNGDRHHNNYLVGEVDAGNEKVLMPFPIDMAKPFGSFDYGSKSVGSYRGEVMRNNQRRFDSVGRKQLEMISDMSVQQVVQYLQRFMTDHPDGAALKQMAETLIQRAQSALGSASVVYGV